MRLELTYLSLRCCKSGEGSTVKNVVSGRRMRRRETDAEKIGHCRCWVPRAYAGMIEETYLQAHW